MVCNPSTTDVQVNLQVLHPYVYAGAPQEKVFTLTPTAFYVMFYFFSVFVSLLYISMCTFPGKGIRIN